MLSLVPLQNQPGKQRSIKDVFLSCTAKIYRPLPRTPHGIPLPQPLKRKTQTMPGFLEFFQNAICQLNPREGNTYPEVFRIIPPPHPATKPKTSHIQIISSTYLDGNTLVLSVSQCQVHVFCKDRRISKRSFKPLTRSGVYRMEGTEKRETGLKKTRRGKKRR